MNSIFQGIIVNFTIAGEFPNYKRANNIILWLKICCFRKSQLTTSFFGGVVAAHSLMIVLH